MFTKADIELMREAVEGLALRYEPEFDERGDVVGSHAFTQKADFTYPIDFPPEFGSMWVYDDGDGESGPCPYEAWNATRADGITMERALALGLPALTPEEDYWRAMEAEDRRES